jgi:hypothetical protein
VEKMAKDVIKLRLNLDGKNKEMFEEIKRKYNLERNTDTLRLIIKLAYDYDIKKED